MACPRRGIATLLAASMVAAASASARAAQVDDRVHVVLQSDRADTVYVIRSATIEIECQVPCHRLVPRGRYQVIARSPDADVPDQDTLVELSSDGYITTRSGSHFRKALGLVLGIGGTISVVAGVVYALHSWPGSCDDLTPDQCAQMNRDQDRRDKVVGILVLAGLASTITGWILFGVNRTTIDVQPAAAPNVTVVAAPVPGGAAFGIVGAF